MTSMFAGDDKNQWLDQVEEEFGSNLSDHDKDDGNGNGGSTTIEIDKSAKESLAKEMKEKIMIWKVSTPDQVNERIARI